MQVRERARPFAEAAASRLSETAQRANIFHQQIHHQPLHTSATTIQQQQMQQKSIAAHYGAGMVYLMSNLYA